MGGSGGGFRNYPAHEIRSWIDQPNSEAAAADQISHVNAALGDLTAVYGDRDDELTRSRMDEIEEAITDSIEGSVDLRFGGSVAKHTDVDGLSDVDLLAMLRDPELARLGPEEVLAHFTETLRGALNPNLEVSVGELAVTVTYADGMKIQILPAVRSDAGLRIASGHGNEWSAVVRPEAFAAKLTEVNQAARSRVIPTIKLAKAALSQVPDSVRPSGYHIESLAVAAFTDYNGPYTLKAMLHHFFEQGSRLALRPIRDRTAQSLNVDSDLGSENSDARRRLSGIMSRIARRMSNADRAGSADDWLASIGE